MFFSYQSHINLYIQHRAPQWAPYRRVAYQAHWRTISGPYLRHIPFAAPNAASVVCREVAYRMYALARQSCHTPTLSTGSGDWSLGRPAGHLAGCGLARAGQPTCPSLPPSRVAGHVFSDFFFFTWEFCCLAICFVKKNHWYNGGTQQDRIWVSFYLRYMYVNVSMGFECR